MSNNINVYGLVGLRFIPTDEELVGYFLLRKIVGIPIFETFVLEYDLYGEENPWEIWQKYNSQIIFNPSDNSQDLYFFTRLKRKKVNAARVERRVGIGAWQGEDSKNCIMSSIDSHICIGSKKRFRFEKSGTHHDGKWIMHEYSLSASVLPPNVSKSIVNELVLCRIRKNEHAGTGQRNKNVKKRKKSPEHDDVDQSQCKSKKSKQHDLEPFLNHLESDNTSFSLQELFPNDPSAEEALLNFTKSKEMEAIGLNENDLNSPEIEREITAFDQETKQFEASDKTCTQEDDFEVLIDIDELLNLPDDD